MAILQRLIITNYSVCKLYIY